MKQFKTLLSQFFVGVNIAVILLLWGSCIVTYLPPDWFPRLSLLSLAFPAFLIADISFVFFWLIFKVKQVWVPIVGLVCCGSFVVDYFPISFSTDSDGDALTILSYNTHSFGGKEAVLDDGSNRIVNFLIDSDADIICLQEATRRDNYEQCFEEAGYHYVALKEYTLCSRLPIIESDTLALSGQPAFALRAFLLDDGDTIMLINQHLESNRLSPEVKEAYVEAIESHQRDSLSKGIKSVAELLALALPERGRQVDSIQCVIDEWLPRPVILCGDFNDTPVSYAHRVLTRHLDCAFRKSGNGLGFTFHDKGFPVRIDHILYSGNRWHSTNTTICDTITCSDHFPIRTKLLRNSP